MGLQAHSQATDYVDYWRAELALTPSQERALEVYTALFVVDFLAEIGQPCNRDASAVVEPAYVRRLEALLRR